MVESKRQLDVQCALAEWYAVYTRHQHEKCAAQVLAARGLEVFLPLYSTAHRWKDRTKQLHVPLFPCYLFVRGGWERPLDVLTAPGVINLVSSAGRPIAVPQAQLDAVRRVLDQGDSPEPHEYLNSGDWVRIISGPLEGLEGILARKKSSFRLVLSVKLLEKSVSVEVDLSAVERIAETRPRIETSAKLRYSPSYA